MRQFCIDNEQNINNIISGKLNTYVQPLLGEMESNLMRKMSRMRVLEEKKHILPDEDLGDNIQTAIKSAVYMTFRKMYNDERISQDNLNFIVLCFSL